MPAINAWIKDAAEQLATIGIESALLDAEILLAHTLRKSRTYLHAHGDDELSPRDIEIANARLDLRLDRTPIAYIIGHKEFYGRLFKVSPSVLIPRPESEDCIHLLNKYYSDKKTTLLDVGTGSGCLGITANLEHPDLSVTLSDISRHALTIAKTNAEQLKADVLTLRSDLLSAIPGRFTYILANLPYVDRAWERSPETNFEPEKALFADDNGVALIKKLINQAPLALLPDGILIVEADPYQHDRIIAHARDKGFELIEALHYTLALRFTTNTTT